jgi:predicted DNA-binding transcriptional regulator YafY
MHDNGSATMTFTVSDVGEVIRWALGFGAEAKVVSPPSALQRARKIAQQIAVSYE